MNLFLRCLLQSLLIQFAILFLCVSVLSSHEVSLLIRIGAPSMLCLGASVLTKLPFGWQIGNAFFPIFLYVASLDLLPPWVFLAGALGVAAFHLPALWSRVPYYPTPPEVYDSILALIPHDEPCQVLDIGCGMGDLLKHIARNRPRARCVGVELAVIPYLTSLMKSIGQPNMLIEYRNYWPLKFSEFDFVYAFLSPAPMESISKKLSSGDTPKRMFISNSFPIPHRASTVTEVSTRKGGTLHLYNFS